MDNDEKTKMNENLKKLIRKDFKQYQTNGTPDQQLYV